MKEAGDYQIINIGPAHPIMHGALRLKLMIEGETIVKARMEIGYLHRCFEKLCESRTWATIMPYTDRLNYCSSLMNNLGYCIAVEEWLNLTVPPRAKAIRVFFNEMHRIMDHCTCLGPGLVDLGALTNLWYLFTVRELAYKLIEEVCGSRLTTTFLRIGGIARDVQPDFKEKAKQFLQDAPKYIDDVRRLIEKNRIFIDRTRDIAKISRDDAIAFSFTGPCGRASGINYDVRKARPYHGYENYDFDVPLGSNGDCYDRYMVRIEEIGQSFRIMKQAIDELPDGPFIIDDPEVVPPLKRDTYSNIEGLINHFKLAIDGIKVPAGEWYSCTESANGELGYFCISDGSGTPYRLKLRPPSFAICQATEKLAVGLMLPDLTALIGSLNIVAGELDR